MRIYRIPAKFLRSVFYASLVAILLSVSGCVALQPVTDAVLWLPRKIIAIPGKLWRKTGFRSADRANEWQDQLDLGPRRRPTNNPGNAFGGSMTGDNPDMQPIGGPPTASDPRQRPYPYPQGNAGGMDQMPPDMPPQMGGGAPQDLMGGYPSPQSGFQPSPMDSGGAGGYPSLQDSGQMPQGGMPQDMQMQQGGMPQGMPDAGGYGGGSAAPYGTPEPYGMGDPYAQPPKKKWSLNPFSRSQRYIRVLEPMAMEVALEGDYEEAMAKGAKKEDNTDLQVYIKEVSEIPEDNKKSKDMFPLKDYAPQHTSSKNQVMFPLEEYAPKSNVPVTQISGKAVDAPNKDAEKNLDALINKIDSADIALPQVKAKAPVTTAVEESNNKTLEETLGVFDADNIAVQAVNQKAKNDGTLPPAELPAANAPENKVEAQETDKKKTKSSWFKKKKKEEPRAPINNNTPPPAITPRKPLILDNQTDNGSADVPAISNSTDIYIAPAVVKKAEPEIIPPPIATPKVVRQVNRPNPTADDSIFKGVLPNSRYSGNR